MVVLDRPPYIDACPRILSPTARTHREDQMARTDAMVLGAGIVGTSIALHLAKRGLSVALVDRKGPGEETSYGNAGILEGNTLLPYPFPAGIDAFLEVVFKQTSAVNYHFADL